MINIVMIKPSIEFYDYYTVFISELEIHFVCCTDEKFRFIVILATNKDDLFFFTANQLLWVI